MLAFFPRFAAALLAGALAVTSAPATAATTGRAEATPGPRAPAKAPTRERAIPRLDWGLDPASIGTSCGATLGRADEAVNHIAGLRTSTRTFGNSVAALETALADASDALVVQRALASLAPEASVRLASQRCNERFGRFTTDVYARPDLFHALSQARVASGARDVFDRKLLADWLWTMRRSGAALSDVERPRLVSLFKELDTLQGDFEANINNDATTLAIGSAQAAGLPADFLASLRRTPEGGYVVPVNESTLQSFLAGQADASLRNAFVLAYNNRAASANVPILQETLAKRDELAHLLGFANWATYVIAGRMAARPERVRKFLDELDERLLPRARADIARLVALKARTTGQATTALQPGDYTYYSALLRRTEYNIDGRVVRDYFPVDHVIEATLSIYGRLLGVNFARIAPAFAWAPDVMKYSVSENRTGKLIGVFYLDLFPRPGKYAHVAHFGLLPTRRLADGQMRAPISAIVGNWPAPAAGRPALLAHSDVVTFFHEFGHNMAAMLADTPYETLSRGYVRDFVEAPSQMLENWVWDPAILREISSNVRTGEPMPEALIAKLIAARAVGEAVKWTRTVALALVDLDYHTSGPHVDTTAVYEDIFARYNALPMPAGTHPQASWTHLMGGYDAGYYGYAWAKVYAQDMFTAFAAGGLENPAVGTRYRDLVLAPARTYDPQVEVERFLGRPVSPQAFYHELGIEVKAASQ